MHYVVRILRLVVVRILYTTPPPRGAHQVLDTMDYAVYSCDVQHIILDNLQFMLGTSTRGRSTVFEAQDTALEKFRRFATDKNVHITLVIHPRKEQDGAPLSLASVFGSAKATQEADTVIALQTVDKDRKRLDVLKNRYDGSTDSILLEFDPSSSSYVSELVDGEVDEDRRISGKKFAELMSGEAYDPHTDIESVPPELSGTGLGQDFYDGLRPPASPPASDTDIPGFKSEVIEPTSSL